MEKFYLGMDIGTESVGMACTDENYKLLRAKGVDMWATRLFEEAVASTDRRTKRLARRRLARRAKRIDLLQDVFLPYMKDNTFFIRLNNSGYVFEDKQTELNNAYSLFGDEEFNDVNFYKKYPTIFHLRKTLIDGKEKYDLRLYYLAVHHIIKYRGHFLFEGENMGDIRAEDLFLELNNAVSDVFGEKKYEFSFDKIRETVDICSSSLGQKEKLNKLKELFGGQQRISFTEMLVLLSGGTAKAENLFEGGHEKEKISFNKITDEEFISLNESFGDDFRLLEAAKSLFDFIRFERILGGCEYISDAMISVYDKHGRDVKRLKKLLKADMKLYKRVFRSEDEANNYVHYVGYNKISGKKSHQLAKCKPEDFFKFLKKLLLDNVDVLNAEEVNKIVSEIDGSSFLPKILNADNGLFPHQINGAELDKILANLVRDYPFFDIPDEEGYTPCEKIKAIFNFKIPYYVGPLNTAHPTSEKDGHGHSWLVRKESGRITPWNYREKIDLSASNEAFMRNMTNKCSYLKGKDVLPKCSIIYQRYNTLNHINKLTVNNRPISVAEKQQIFDELFMKQPKVSVRDIKQFMKNKGWYVTEELKDDSIGGIDGDIKPSMNSYVNLKRVLGDFVDEHPDVCEDIILWHTLNTDKKVVEELILKRYGDIAVIKDKIKELKALTFKDFGRLSKEFLCEIEGGIDEATGEVYTLIGQLYNTNQNLNELLNDKRYSFLSALERENGEAETEVTYKDVEDLYVSPAVRRGIWQSLLMVDEYVEALSCGGKPRYPDKIFIEVTRGGGKKGDRKASRKAQLENLYKDLKDIDALREELKMKKEGDLRSERLYLYFAQLGRCAYTGKRIDLDSLFGDMYDVDHIIPRAKTKDDSIDNKVLVLREKNSQKTDIYPLPAGFTDQQKFWKILLEKNLMSKSKYDRLTRTVPLTAEDLQGFINRQIVFTGQTVKAVAELLKRKYGKYGTKIVYSKAGNVSDFKGKFGLVKCRETNDFHHARDAYLNIVVGNVYDTKFSSPQSYFRYNAKGEQTEYNFDKLFNYPIAGAWKGISQLEEVKKTYYRTSMAVTKFSFVNKGKFYDETIYPKSDRGVSVPRKANGPLADTSRYGGYKSLKTAYFAIVESKGKKNDRLITIEAVPVIVDYNAKGSTEKILEYFRSQGLKEPKLLIGKLKVHQLVKVNDYPAYIAGITGSQIILHNAIEWFTDEGTDNYVKALTKLSENGEVMSDVEKSQEEFVMNTNRFGDKKIVINRMENISLYNKIRLQLEKRFYLGISGAKSFAENLDKGYDKFCEISVFDQTAVLLQCIKFLKCNGENVDLSKIGGGARCGILLINKKITSVNFNVIHQSPCGLIVRKIKVR